MDKMVHNCYFAKFSYFTFDNKDNKIRHVQIALRKQSWFIFAIFVIMNVCISKARGHACIITSPQKSTASVPSRALS